MLKKHFTDVNIDIFGILIIALVGVNVWDGYFTQQIGIVLAVLSFVLFVFSRIHLQESLTEEGKLVTDGVFSKIRLPKYVFSSFCLFGLALAVNHIITYIVLFALIFFLLKKMKEEEKVLEEKFGEKYQEYKKNTWL